jgi:hypothetical protein
MKIVATGAVEIAQWGRSLEVPLSHERSLLLAFATNPAPAMPPPKDAAWVAATSGLPEPRFLPAISTASATLFGATVTVHHIDTRRFAWTLVAGAEERSHRRGGQFTKTLVEADAARARLAVGLGVGKRKGPRGLRIDGTTGHGFSQKEGLLLAGSALRLVKGADLDPEAQPDDACELPFTAVDSRLVELARERGPLQVRVDGCLRGDGALLLAQSEFDSHEANATLLTQLGCESVFAFDRGAEHASFFVTDDAARGPFDDTVLVGLEQPLKGRVTRLFGTSD